MFLIISYVLQWCLVDQHTIWLLVSVIPCSLLPICVTINSSQGCLLANVNSFVLKSMLSFSYRPYVSYYSIFSLPEISVLFSAIDQAALETEARITPLIHEKKRLFNDLLTLKGTLHNVLLLSGLQISFIYDIF